MALKLYFGKMCDALSRTIRRRINDSKEILKLFKHEGIRPHMMVTKMEIMNRWKAYFKTQGLFGCS